MQFTTEISKPYQHGQNSVCIFFSYRIDHCAGPGILSKNEIIRDGVRQQQAALFSDGSDF